MDKARLSGLRFWALVMAGLLVTGACSGGGGKSEELTSAAGDEAKVIAGDDKGRIKKTDGGASTTATINTTRTQTTLTTPEGITVTKPKSGGPPVANLFTAAEDKIGLLDTKVIFCGHAATTFGPAFNTSEDDLNVYWEEVGKIHGRNVEVSYENDNYDPTTAIQAAQACKSKNPFVFLGGIGFDQIPAVRKFAEDNHMFYVHHIAIEDLKKKYSFSPLPSVEQAGDFAGQWAGSKYGAKKTKVGIIYRESENWDPGRETFTTRLKSLGGKVIAQAGVTKNQGSYITELNDLKMKGAEVVFVWENALAATAIIQEAKSQNWNPQFLIFPFNVTADAIGDQMLNPPVHGISTWPAYSPGDYSGPFASYASEIKKMESVYAARRPGIKPTDIHWMVWLAYRDLHATLVDCGRDCTRNKLLGLMLWRKYGADEMAPSCPVDYTRNGHVGGFWANMFTAYERPDGKAGWKHITGNVCRESFLN